MLMQDCFPERGQSEPVPKRSSEQFFDFGYLLGFTEEAALLVPELDPFFRFPFFELLDRLVQGMASIPRFPVQHPIMLPSAVALSQVL